MFKKYEERPYVPDPNFKFTVCECGHLRGMHNDKNECEECQCSKYKFYKKMTMEEREKEQNTNQ